MRLKIFSKIEKEQKLQVEERNQGIDIWGMGDFDIFGTGNKKKRSKKRKLDDIWGFI